jgi:molybdopterin-containing oxidoreductase family membrane subunit
VSSVSDAKRSDRAALAEKWGYTGLGSLRESRTLFLAALILLALVTVGATVIGFQAMYEGYGHVYGTTRQIPWGILIAGYIFCVVTSTGLCLVSSIGHVFGAEAFMPIAKRAVFLSIVFMLAGFYIIFFEIESPIRLAIYTFASPNLRSNMWWMGTLYGVYLLAMTVEYFFLLDQKHARARAAGLCGVVFGVAAHSNLGAIFGMLHGRDFWYGPYMPIYFIASAMVSGGAAILLFTTMAAQLNPVIYNERLERANKSVTQLTILLIAVLMFFTFWKIASGFVAPEKYVAIRAFLSGGYTTSFWGGEILLGMVIPFVLLIKSKGTDIRLIFAASALMMIGVFFMRLDLIIAGQIVPVFHALNFEEYRGLLAYTPSFHEIAVLVGGLTLVGTLYLLGEKLLSGHQFQKHEFVPEGGYICPGCGAIHFRKTEETEEEATRRHHEPRDAGE